MAELFFFWMSDISDNDDVIEDVACYDDDWSPVEEETSDDGEETEDDDAVVCVNDATTNKSQVDVALYTGDVLLELELAALEGREACRIDSGADLAHGDTGGLTHALDLARRFVGDLNGQRRPPFVVVRNIPHRGVHRLHLRSTRIARTLYECLPSP